MNDLTKIMLEVEKLEDLKVLLLHKMISYSEYLDFFKVTFKINKKGVNYASK